MSVRCSGRTETDWWWWSLSGWDTAICFEHVGKKNPSPTWHQSCINKNYFSVVSSSIPPPLPALNPDFRSTCMETLNICFCVWPVCTDWDSTRTHHRIQEPPKKQIQFCILACLWFWGMGRGVLATTLFSVWNEGMGMKCFTYRRPIRIEINQHRCFCPPFYVFPWNHTA